MWFLRWHTADEKTTCFPIFVVIGCENSEIYGRRVVLDGIDVWMQVEQFREEEQVLLHMLGRCCYNRCKSYGADQTAYLTKRNKHW